jgi:DNA-binding response OmpR family regulator
MDTRFVLHIEDSVADAAVVRQLLNDENAGSIYDERFVVSVAPGIADGILQLNKGAVDVVLLDLGLPDSQGLDGLAQIKERAPHVPVIVLTGVDDRVTGVEAVSQGAQDYLVKSQFDSEILLRCMRYAIERQRSQQQLAESLESEKRKYELELSMLEQAVTVSGTSITASLLGQMPLSQRQPNDFSAMVERYRNLIKLAYEQRTFKVNHSLSVELHSLADHIGSLNGIPRDVVDVHSDALRMMSKDVALRRSQVYREEAHFILLELMGYLCSFYQKYSIGKVARHEAINKEKAS